MEALSCDVLLKIASELGPGDYVQFAQVSKTIQTCLDTGKFSPNEAEQAKNIIANLRQQYGIYYLPSAYNPGDEYNILDLYKSVEYGLNTRKEFENFITYGILVNPFSQKPRLDYQPIPVDKLIINDEGGTVLDAVYEAEYQLGSYEPLNDGQVVIAFYYPEKKVKMAYSGQLVTLGTEGRFIRSPDYFIVWSK